MKYAVKKKIARGEDLSGLTRRERRGLNMHKKSNKQHAPERYFRKKGKWNIKEKYGIEIEID